MAVPFLSSIKLNKNQVEDFCIYNLANDPSPTSGADFGYFWLNTGGSKTLRWWDGTTVRTILDSASTINVADNLSGGVKGSLPYQDAVNDTVFLGIGTAGQVLSVATNVPAWVNQSSLSVGSATNATNVNPVGGGDAGALLYQTATNFTGALSLGSAGHILRVNTGATAPEWSATIPSSSVSGLAASATTDTTNAANISSGLLPLARLALATGQFYLGDASNNPVATAKTSIPLSGFGAAGANVAMGGFKITGLADPVDATDAANRKYVDEVAQGLDVKASCLTATTTNINLSAPTASIGGVTISTVGSRVLVKDQTDKTQNGIYLWQGASSAMTRSLDADTVAKLVGAFTFVEQGTNADSGWVCQVDSGTIGSVDIEWTKFSQAGSYTAGNGMVLVGGQFSFATSNPYTTGEIPYAYSSNEIRFKSVTGTGDVVLATSPTLVTPALGAATATSINKLTITAPATGSTLTIADGKTLTASNTLTFTGTDSSSVAFGAGGTVAYTGGTLAQFAATTSSQLAGVISDETGTGSLVFATSPTLAGTPLSTTAAADTNTTQIATTAFVIGQAASTNPSNLGPVAVGTSLKYARADHVHAIPTIDLTANVTGTLPIANGGTGATSFTAGRVLFGGTSAINTSANLFWDNTNNRLGIGTATPNATVSIKQTGAQMDVSTSATDVTFECIDRAATTNAINTRWYTRNGEFQWNNSSYSRAMTLDSSGNLGVGVTPNTWTAGFKAIQLSAGSALWSNGAVTRTAISANHYYNGNDLFIGTGYAHSYWQDGANGHRWFTSSVANAGAAGSVATLNETMRLDASGNLYTAANGRIGVGVVPTTPLQVNGSGVNIASIVDTSATGYSGIVLKGTGTQNYSIGMGGPSETAFGVANKFFLYDGLAGAMRMVIDASGNLGVGVTTVGERIHASGNIKAAASAGNFPRFISEVGAKSWATGYRSGTTSFEIWEDSTTRLAIANGGQVRVGINGTASVPAIALAANPDTGLYFPTGDDTLALAVGGSDAVFIDSSRRVGIGTSTPSAGTKLDVRGGQLYLEVSSNQTNSQIALFSNQTTVSNNGVRVAFDAYNIGQSAIGLPSGSASLAFYTNGIADANERLRIKSTGQLNFTGLAADPTGAVGDLYYNSATDSLQLYSGAWNTLTRKISAAGVGTGATITVTHNWGTRDVLVQVRNSSHAQVLTDVTYGEDSVTVTFADSNTTLSNYTVTVIG